MSSQRVPELEERSLHGQWQELRHHPEAPENHPAHLELSVAVVAGEGSIAYELNRCFPSIARNAASEGLARPLHNTARTSTVAGPGTVAVGTLVLLGIP